MQTLIDHVPEKDWADWLHSSWPWQLYVTVRLPNPAPAEELRRQLNDGLIRPLAKQARTLILGVGALVRDPAEGVHAHLLLYSRDIDLSPFITKTAALDIRHYRNRGGALYVVKNLLRDRGGLNDFWTFGQRHLLKDMGTLLKGPQQPGIPLRERIRQQAIDNGRY